VNHVLRSDTARRIVLILPALAFLRVAVGALVAPQTMASQFHLRLDHVDALNEYRAVYVGLWLAQAVIFGWAVRDVRRVWLGDLGALLVLGQVVGRLVSFVLDGLPSAQVWPTFAAELVAGVALIVVRPASPTRT